MGCPLGDKCNAGHPSVTCYGHHKCRCDPCRNLATKYTYERREARSGKKTKLSDWELVRLRRMVGLNDDGSERQTTQAS